MNSGASLIIVAYVSDRTLMVYPDKAIKLRIAAALVTKVVRSGIDSFTNLQTGLLPSGNAQGCAGALTLSTLVTIQPTVKKPYHLIEYDVIGCGH